MFQENKILEIFHCQETCTKRNVKDVLSGREYNIRSELGCTQRNKDH